MKHLIEFIFEKFKISKDIQIEEEIEYIQTLGEIICINHEKEPLQDYLKGKREFDKKFFEQHKSNLWRILTNKKWIYGRNINREVRQLFEDILNDNIDKDKLKNIQYNLLQGFKNAIYGNNR